MKRLSWLSLGIGVCTMVAAAQDEPMVRGIDFVMVCEDAGAGAYEAFPDVCRLQDGRLMCVFYAGWKHVSLPDAAHPKGGRVSVCYSGDEGRTWTPAKTLVDTPDDDRDPSIVQLADGRILCNFFILRKDGESYRGLGSWLVESADNGATWSNPRIISPYYCSAPIRVLSNGRLILGLYTEHQGNAWGAVTVSDDRGATWSPPIDIPNAGVKLDAETDIVELKDGRLYAAQRAPSGDMHYSTSADQGTTWSESKPMGYPGHCPYFHRAPDGTIVCAHRVPNTSLHYSTDDCATWSGNVEVDSVGGAYPSMATLKDGATLIVYYEEGEGSSIRARKFTTSADGIQWLKWTK
ncbi:MAG: hypothetical protein AMXMBFR84_46160 [Candidatus Hydrogenedentota bacterium]